MDENTYKTVSGAAPSAEFTEKRSRFIGDISHAETGAEAEAFIDEIKKAHPGATHYVYAYILRAGNTKRYSDDSEPSKTAGVPVLDVIEKNNITDVVLVVTRYFGGTLLGTGGLVRAYSKAALMALEGSSVVRMARCVNFTAVLDYAFYDTFSALLATFGCEKPAVTFKENVSVGFALRCELKGDFIKACNEKFSGRVKLLETGQSFAAVSSD